MRNLGSFRPRHSASLLGLLGTIAVASVQAQVPPGAYVISSFQNSFSFPGRGGLWLFDPVTADECVRIEGVGEDLETGGGLGIGGANCVLVRPRDGAILVGEGESAGLPVRLHVIHLEGTQVIEDRTILLGTSARAGQVHQLTWLPDERLLVGVSELVAPGPLANASLGIVDLTSGEVRPVPIGEAPFPGSLNAITVDPERLVAYYAVWRHCDATDIFRVPLPDGGEPELAATIPAGISGMHWGFDDDRLWASAFGSVNLLAIDPSTGVWEALCPSAPSELGDFNALTVNPRTGALAVVTGEPCRRGSAPPNSVLIDGPCFERPVCTTPPDGWGLLSGIAVHPGLPDGDGNFRRGDVNADGRRNLVDALGTLGFLFGGSPPLSCPKAADVDDDGVLNLTDPIFLLAFIFRNGPAPAEPFAECGSDRTPDRLACEVFDGC